MALALRASRWASVMPSAISNFDGSWSGSKAIPASPADLGVLRGVAVEHQRAAAHGLDQRGMRAAYLGSVDVREAVRSQLAVALAVNGSGDHDARVARCRARGAI